MNLKELAAKMASEGFDPKTAVVDQDDYNFPDGVYDVVVESVEHRVSDKGTEWISIALEILNEGYEKRKYFANYWLTEKSLERTIKRLWADAEQVFGVEITIEDIGNIETDFVEKMQSALGMQLELDLKTSRYKDKKTNEQKEWQNFKLSVQTPF
ncbi:hypothetical protein BTO30_14980 [Domibacillus antri]|uniref:DUF669 domain-containing protein n=1 Tax=Domibacillus antri TaxID=1714264 RepID=A0A1Q8Q251_9BACI|nr:DUF669 domain-containing protein [Domibacillus antri]OLN21419.1 hypothetical protein BTO30_14980 [Domibacillus antri]